MKLFNPGPDVKITYAPFMAEKKDENGNVINSIDLEIRNGETKAFPEDQLKFLIKRYGFLRQVADSESGEIVVEPVPVEVPKVPDLPKEALIERQLDPTLQDEIHSVGNRELRIEAKAKYGKTFKIGTRNQEIIDFLNSQKKENI